LAQPPSRLSPSTSPSTSLHAFFLAFPWLPHHEEFNPLLLFSASRFHHAQLPLKLAQEAKAPRSSSITKRNSKPVRKKKQYHTKRTPQCEAGEGSEVK